VGTRSRTSTAWGASTNASTPPAVSSSPAHWEGVGTSSTSTKLAPIDSSGIEGTTIAVQRARSRCEMAWYQSSVPT
jgi:hypothetical protein